MTAGWVLAMLAGPSLAQVPSAANLQNPELERTSGASLRAGANSFAESQAKDLLAAQGYSQISALVNDSQGIWRGTAMKDDRKVDVSVDFQGHIAAQ